MAKETILILDKEQHNQWVLKSLLENEKYIVIAVDSTERAKQNFSEFEVAGLVTEYWIGHERTLETIRKLKRIFPEAYVMMLTDAVLEDRDYEEILEAGVDDYFLKPQSTRKILLHLKKGLKQRSALLQRNRFEQEIERIKSKKNYQGPEGINNNSLANKTIS